MKLTDYIANFIAKQGTTHVFGLTGGAVVHLFDSVARHEKLNAVFCHHEQAASFAVEAYAKLTGNLGFAFFTTGPGATNALTGLTAAWLDSIPCVFVSGQARLSHTAQGKKIRQLGTQHVEVVPLVSSITKYAVLLKDKNDIRYELEKAAYLAKSGRPGPVWIDIPLDLQWADVDPENLKSYIPDDVDQTVLCASPQDVNQFKVLLKNAMRPIVIAGFGIRLAGAIDQLSQFIQQHNIPLLCTWGAVDILPTDDKLYLGRPGLAGQRGANLAMQNADLIIAIGTHLNIPTTGTNFANFARDAKIVIITNDENELDKQTIRVDLPICADAKTFLNELSDCQIADLSQWHNYLARYKKYNEIIRDRYPDGVNQYVVVDALNEYLNSDNHVVVDGGGTNVYIAYHSLKLKLGQRMILSTSLCAMGSGIPEAIGVAMANPGHATLCLCGDGSFQLNVQELQTLIHHQLPVKLFVFNNSGYVSIRQTQDGFLEQRHFGSETKGGMSVPDICKVASAYGLATCTIKSEDEIRDKINWMLKQPGPTLCEVYVSPNQQIVPTQGFDKKADGTATARPLEDMAPYLPRDEFASLMVVKPSK